MDATDPIDHAFEHAPIGLALVSADGVIRRINAAGAAITGHPADQLVGRSFADFLHPDDVAMAWEAQQQNLDTGLGGPVLVRARRADGTWLWLRGHGTALPTPEQTLFVTFEDVTDEVLTRERAEQAEELSARRAAQQEAVARLGRTALEGAVLGELGAEASELVRATLGAPFAGVVLEDGAEDGSLGLVAAAGPLSELVGHYRHPRDERVDATLARREPTVVTDLAADAGEGGRRLLVEAGVRSVVATPILPRNAARGMLICGSDRTGGFAGDEVTFLESVANVLASAIDAHQAVDDLRYSALHDDLTRLPNRALLLDRLELALEQGAHEDCQVAVLVCDVDRFKVVNDGMGHAAGDEVLRIVAERLRHHVRPGDTVGRFGGDEFVVVCPDIEDPGQVIDIAERLGGAFHEPINVGGTDLVATASIGIALGAEPGKAAAAGLLRDADAAMYRAKAHGRARWELFDDAMRAWASERLRLETELRTAIGRGELVLHYQPVLALGSGDVVGVEALVRWLHPERGLLMPDEFLPVAEDAGLMADLGAWTFRQAARQTAEWCHASGWDGRWTAVNLSPHELGDRRVVERVAEVLGHFELEATAMRVELTEQALVDETRHAMEVLDGLRDRGVRISIDDFGTGYSSLGYLKRLPVDCLKLDRVFVAGLGEREDDELIAAAVISMAQALGLQVVAEGVETDQQLSVLRAMGCDQAQGYRFARPMPAGDLTAWLSEHQP